MSLTDSAIKKTEHYTSVDPDVRLMLQVKADDAGAFEELTRRYQNRALHVLEHLIGDRDQAEDLAQEVFLRVFRSRKTYVPGAKFSTWFFTIANNVANNARKKRSRKKEVHVSTKQNEDSTVQSLETMAKEASGLMPTRQLEKMEVSDIVQMAMESALNERQRMALLLSKFEQMSYQDIASTMGLTVQAIKSLLSRARGNLKAALEPYFEKGLLPRAIQNPIQDNPDD